MPFHLQPTSDTSKPQLSPRQMTVQPNLIDDGAVDDEEEKKGGD